MKSCLRDARFLMRRFRLLADPSEVAFIRLSHVMLLFTVAFEFKQELWKNKKTSGFFRTPFLFLVVRSLEGNGRGVLFTDVQQAG